MKTLKSADLVPVRKIKWAWNERIPCGGLTLIAAEPRIGASIFVNDLVARASTGVGWPHHEWETSKYKVALLAGEHEFVSARLTVKSARKGKITLLPPYSSFQSMDALDVFGKVTLIVVDDYLTMSESGLDRDETQRVDLSLQTMNSIARESNTAIIAVARLSPFPAVQAQQKAHLMRSRNLVSLVTLSKIGNATVIQNPISCWGPNFPSLELIIRTATKQSVTAAKAKYRKWVEPAVMVERPLNRTDRAIEFVANHLVDGMDSNTFFSLAAASGLKKGVVHIALDTHGVTRKRVGGRGTRGKWVLRIPQGRIFES